MKDEKLRVEHFLLLLLMLMRPCVTSGNVREIQWNELIFVAVPNLFGSSAANLQV